MNTESPMPHDRRLYPTALIWILVVLPLAFVCLPLAQAASERAPETVANAAPPSPSAKMKALEKSSLIVTPDYIIGPEDMLEIAVWKNAELSKKVMVRPDGRISLPLIGDVMATGRTPTELTDEISKRLREYKENPTVSIVVEGVNSYNVFVIGEVSKPGKFPLKTKTTLLQALAIAGGFTQVAVRNKMMLFRLGEDGKGQEKLKLAYDDIVLRDATDQNLELKPGDTLVIPSETMVLLK